MLYNGDLKQPIEIMIMYFRQLANYLKVKITHKKALPISIVFLLLSVVSSSLHYMILFPGNNLSWISWVIAVVIFSYSFAPRNFSIKKILGKIKRRDLFIGLFVTLLYFTTHLWNISSAPWNQNGLFDDAAWDIYFAKNQVFSGAPFQPAFFDSVGLISREVVFHYYISGLFKVFGYNLPVFNFSLLILGFVTVFFTTFIIHRIFNDTRVTLLSALIINFFPLHYMHIFMGHRYAIAAPLMVVSLYFLYTALSNKSLFRVATSALFAALCLSSAIMGKQYILGLALSFLAYLIFRKRKESLKEGFAFTLVWITGFIISATPLLIYIIFNYQAYVLREQGLLREFFSLFLNGGVGAIRPYVDGLIELFFAKHTFQRQFLPDFPIIPLGYYLLLIPGLFIALLKKRFEIVFLSIIPTLGALVSGSYDFRVLLSVPIWVIAMAFSLNHIFSSKRIASKLYLVIGLAAAGLGLIPSISYLWNISKNPNYLYLLPHKDVAISRLVQDIVAGTIRKKEVESSKGVLGITTIKDEIKQDEFRREMDSARPQYDTLFCPYSSYAIAHLFLQDFDDKKILSFCNQGIQLLKTPKEIFEDNFKAILNYVSSDKDLKMIWEVSDKSEAVIEIFSKYKKYGSEEIITKSVDGRDFSLYVLTIASKNIKSFQRDIKMLSSKEKL